MKRRAVLAAAGLLGVAGITWLLMERVETPPPLEFPLATSPDLTLDPLYRSYDFGEAGRDVRVGMQPLYYPTVLILEAMRRDVVLKEELDARSVRLEFFPFYKGDDVNQFLLRGDLDVGVGGDMPALRAVASGGVTIASVVHRGYTTVLSRRSPVVADLKGRRVGYALGSNAHYALAKVLQNEGLSPGDVELVPLEVTEMPAALESGRVDAFSAWEPIVEATVMRSPGTVVTSRALSYGFLYFSDRLIDEQPAVARALLAAQVRATRWILRSSENLLRATNWSIQEAERFSGESFPLSTARAMVVAERELRGLISWPSLSEAELVPFGPLSTEFRLLKEWSWIDTDLSWDELLDTFDDSMIKEVLSSPDLYRLEDYRFLPQPDSNP